MPRGEVIKSPLVWIISSVENDKLYVIRIYITLHCVSGENIKCLLSQATFVYKIKQNRLTHFGILYLLCEHRFTLAQVQKLLLHSPRVKQVRLQSVMAEQVQSRPTSSCNTVN